MKIKETLVYPVADILSLSLHDMGDKGIRGAGDRVLQTGPLQLQADMVVACTGHTADKAAFMARVVGDLWLCMLVKLLAAGRTEVVMLSVDDRTLGIKPKDLGTLPYGITATLDFVEKAVTATLTFDQQSKTWTRNAAYCLDEFRAAQDT
mgnify:CR=1 FL=1